MRVKFSLLFLFLSFNLSFSQINFVDQASLLGLNSETGYSEFGGAGASFVDFDNDGFKDITLATGDNIPVKFYRNIDGLFFVEVDFFQDSLNYIYRTRSITWVDYDNDGDKDLFLTSDTDGNRLFNRDNSTLIDVTLASGFPLDNLYTYGASWGDIDNDGCLEVYISNRRENTTITNYLFKNNCDGTFSEVTNFIGLSNSPALTFCSGFFDFNNDGWQDLYVANDKLYPNYLYKNNGDGTFSDVSSSSGTNIVMDAMSVTIDDFNSDGFLDIFITNTPDGVSTPHIGCTLFKNNGDETFTNIAVESGTDLNSFSWGSSFLDADNDGDLDLYVNTQYTSDSGYPAYAFYQSNGNETFVNQTNVGFATNSYLSYASAIGDYNNDGKLEIIVNNDLNQIPSFWENLETLNDNYLSVNLEGVQSNTYGVGSVIEISINGNKQYRYVMCGEGYMSQNSYTEHFGVGNATNIDYVKVKWLSGMEDTIFNVSPNQILNIIEGSSLSINDYYKSSTKVHPNPAENLLFIEQQNSVESVEIINLLGKTVKFFEMNNYKIHLDISTLNPGVYFLRFKSQNTTEIIKFIKK